jgi:predicted GH43/DUF377 family glycosyl hydrolase
MKMGHMDSRDRRTRVLRRTSGLRLAAALLAALALPAATHADAERDASHTTWARAAMLMYYTGKADDTKQIGVAKSRDGLNWKKFPGNPVLTPGAPGEWDDLAVTDAGVIREKNGNRLFLYYAGEGEGAEREEIGVAVSRDGVHFTKHPDNPVIPVGPPGSFDEFEVSNPMVVIRGGRYHLYYAAKGVNEAGEEIETTGLAVSDDGENWTKVGRALDVGLPGSFDQFEVSDPGIARISLLGRSGSFQGDPVLLNYYTAASGDTSVDPEGRRSIGMAFSRDGRDWFKVGRPVIEHGPDGAFDALRVGNVEPELLQNSVFAYYGGRTRVGDVHGEDVGAIGLAISKDGFTFEKLATPVLMPTAPWEGTLTANASVIILNH